VKGEGLSQTPLYNITFILLFISFNFQKVWKLKIKNGNIFQNSYGGLKQPFTLHPTLHPTLNPTL
jgi:hypothetical protein